MCAFSLVQSKCKSIAVIVGPGGFCEFWPFWCPPRCPLVLRHFLSRVFLVAYDLRATEWESAACHDRTCRRPRPMKRRRHFRVRARITTQQRFSLIIACRKKPLSGQRTYVLRSGLGGTSLGNSHYVVPSKTPERRRCSTGIARKYPWNRLNPTNC